jgi:hypothetical protein
VKRLRDRDDEALDTASRQFPETIWVSAGLHALDKAFCPSTSPPGRVSGANGRSATSPSRHPRTMIGKIMDLFPLGLWEQMGFNSNG